MRNYNEGNFLKFIWIKRFIGKLGFLGIELEIKYEFEVWKYFVEIKGFIFEFCRINLGFRVIDVCYWEIYREREREREVVMLMVLVWIVVFKFMFEMWEC